MTLLSINPVNEQTIAEYKTHSADRVDELITEAKAAFEEWRFTPLKERASILRNTASLLKDNRESYALLMTREMGKPISQSLAEVDKCADACLFYADKSWLRTWSSPKRLKALSVMNHWE